MHIPILFEDDFLFVIDKPAGLVVNRALSVKEGTVQDWAEEKLRAAGLGFHEEDKEFQDRAGIVHRIDKETSGLLLIAKNPQVFSALQLQFKERLVKKTYWAIVHGKLVPETGEIRAPVGRLPWNPQHFGIVPAGREAVTGYKVLSSWLRVCQNDKEELSLVELYPQTGRTHQIRVHLKYVAHPIVGDYLYAGRKTGRDDRKWAPRVMLHAAEISFRHPVTSQKLELASPMPDDMKRLIVRS